MKSIIISMIFLVVSISNLYSQRIVRIGAFDLYPAIFQDQDGKIKGFYVDAFKEIEEKETIQFEYVFGTWSEGLERIKTGEIDVMVSVAYTEERSQYMDYSSTPLLTVWGEVYVMQSSSIDGILALENKTIAVMKSDANGGQLKFLTKKLSINCTYVEKKDFQEVFESILSKEVDAGVVNNTYGSGRLGEYDLRSSGIVFNPFDIFITVSKNKNKEILSLFDQYLKTWIHDKNSVYNKARLKWSHGKVGEIHIIPEWLKFALNFVIGISIIFAIFILLLRYQVKKVTAKVRSSEAIKNAMVSNIGDVIVIFDQNGIINYKSSNVTKLFGWEPYELIGKGILENVYPEDLEATNNFFNKIVKQTNASGTTELQYRCKDGCYVWIEITVANLINDKDIKGFLGNYHEITERKQFESELIIAKDRAEESDRLKTAFLQNISHEIRTPLNAICGFSEMLSTSNLPDEKRNKFISMIQSSSNKLLSIVTDILTISSLETKQEKLDIEKVCINNLLAELLLIFNKQIDDSSIKLYAKKALNDKQSEISTDTTKITQVLSNLISNAIKFTQKGFIEFGYNLKNNELRFYVKDSGIGIKPELQENIFERFQQADKNIQTEFGGTGLGLSISKGFVELLGGKIWVHSELNKGSTFYFTIPYKPVNKIGDH